MIRPEISSILVSGSRARVGSRGIEREGLTLAEYEAVMANLGDRNVSDAEFRRVRTKPLLLIHSIKGYTRSGDDPATEEDYLPGGPLLVALGLSFPVFDDSEIAGRVEYKVNAIEWSTLVGSEEDDDVASDDDID